MSSWIAAATSYSTNDRIMVPFYIFYSMFGFQRIGDLAWAAGDMQSRGFLLGATRGRTTLNGEGLQHQDGHSHLMSATIPNCVSYDPTFAHELAVILQHGLRRMVEDQEVVTVTGKRLKVQIDTICVHGDNPAAVAMARTVRQTLEAAGVTIRPFKSA